MLPRVTRAYDHFGFKVNIGGPFNFSFLTDKYNGRLSMAGSTMSASDFALFETLSRLSLPINGWLIAGNTFGLSAFMLAELFPSALIDIIDCRPESDEKRKGCEITRQIAAEFFPNVSLTACSAPADFGRAMRLDKYSAVLIEVVRKDEELILDFESILPRLADDAIVIFHDVGLFMLYGGWRRCRSLAQEDRFIPFELPFTNAGSAVLVRGFPEAQSLLSLIGRGLQAAGNRRYPDGRPYSPRRPAWFHRTVYEHELKLRLALRNAWPAGYHALINIVRWIRRHRSRPTGEQAVTHSS